jgi:hypothetical protein
MWRGAHEISTSAAIAVNVRAIQNNQEKSTSKRRRRTLVNRQLNQSFRYSRNPVVISSMYQGAFNGKHHKEHQPTVRQLWKQKYLGVHQELCLARALQWLFSLDTDKPFPRTGTLYSPLEYKIDDPIEISLAYLFSTRTCPNSHTKPVRIQALRLLWAFPVATVSSCLSYPTTMMSRGLNPPRNSPPSIGPATDLRDCGLYIPHRASALSKETFLPFQS